MWFKMANTNQQKLAEKLKDKNLTLIGIGNSTIEMLMQIQELKSKGINIKYKVLTHYPEESVKIQTNT